MINLNNSKNCYGCSACEQICPQEAISMQENEEGFLYPIIDEKKCINCGLCQKVCPEININFNVKKQQYYIGYNSNNKDCYESSSGGIFTLLAKEILQKNGYVAGAMFDENATLKHVLIDNEKDLNKLKGSKYLQSDLNNTFVQIQEKLKQNKYVLFCGTPCQCAGLKNFLQRDYENLYLVDFVCHGVPSQKIFKEYLIERFGNNKKYSYINFRDKRNSYYFPKLIIKDENNKEVLNGSFIDSLYLRGFSENLYLRQSCSNCQFAQANRISDITLSDFWNVRYYLPNFNYEKGFSSFIISSKKGVDLIENLKNKISHLEKVNFKIISQPCLKKPSEIHKNRNLFFKLKHMKFSKKVETCLGIKNVGIINFQDENANYGALFVAYSMKKIVEKLGYNAFNINFIRTSQTETNKPFDDFRRKYLNLTKPCHNIKDLQDLQADFNIFISGGDQVFKDFSLIYSLSWVEGYKKIISYAASLGANNFSYYTNNRAKIAKLLTRFDNVAVREDSASLILNNLGISSKSVIDSVFLLEKEEYNKIILDDTDIKIFDKKYIACALWNFDEIKETNFYKRMKNKYTFINILENENKEYNSFGQYLNLIKNAEYVISNSYHAVVFSIIYQKKFLAVRLNDMRDDRLITLFTKLQINQERLVYSVDDIDYELIRQKIDYKLVKENLLNEQEYAFKYLKEALESSSKFKYPCLLNKVKVKFFKLFTLFEIIDSLNKKVVYLLKKILILKIKNNKAYLLGFLPIFNIK